MKRHLVLLCLLVILIASGCSRKAATYLERGNKLSAAGKYQDAALEYRKAIQKDPNLGEAYYQLAMADEHQGEWLEAFQALNKAVALMPQNEAAMGKLGALGFEAYIDGTRRPKKFYDIAASMAERLLAKNPNSFDGLRLKGDLALLDHKPQEAIGFLQKATRIQPDSGSAVLSLTQALIEAGRFPEGEQLALQFIQKQKEYGAIYDVLSRHYTDLKRQQDAERMLLLKCDNNPKNPNYRLQLAEFYVRTKQPERVSQALQRMLDDPATFPQARLFIGDFYIRIGNPEEALRQFEEGARSNSKDKPVYQIRLARMQTARGKPDQALETLNAVLKEHPDNDEAASIRATLWMTTKKPENLEAAVRALQELVRRKPDDNAMRADLGLAYVLKGDLESGKKELREALRKQSNLDRARFLLANIALGQNNAAESLRYVEEILARNPEDPSARLLRAQNLMRLNRLGEARGELDRLARQYPQSLDTQLQLGALAVLEKRYADAERTFQRLRASSSTERPAALGLAELYAEQKQFDKAVQMLAEEAKKSGDASVRKLLAETALRAKKYDVAIAEYRQLLAKAPQSSDLLAGLGQVYEAKGDLGNAIIQYREAWQNAPKDMFAASHLAAALHQSGKPDEAMSIYRQLAASLPEDPNALNNVAYVICESGGNLDEAMKLAQRAVQKAPDNPSILDTLAWIYLKKGMTDNAVQLFGNVVQKNPDNANFRYHLGSALLKKGDKLKARSELQAALSRTPQPAVESKIRELLASI